MKKVIYYLFWVIGILVVFVIHHLVKNEIGQGGIKDEDMYLYGTIDGKEIYYDGDNYSGNTLYTKNKKGKYNHYSAMHYAHGSHYSHYSSRY